MTIRWRSAPGFKGHYKVSDRGLVKSIGRSVFVRYGSAPDGSAGYWRSVPGRVLAVAPYGEYLGVGLSKGNRVTRFYLHILVCTAFHGPIPARGWQVNHKDLDKLNNRADNIEWMTRSDNTKHALSIRGSWSPRKVSIEDARLIRASASPVWKLAKRFGVGRQTIYNIRNGKSHRDDVRGVDSLGTHMIAERMAKVMGVDL